VAEARYLRHEDIGYRERRLLPSAETRSGLLHLQAGALQIARGDLLRRQSRDNALMKHSRLWRRVSVDNMGSNGAIAIFVGADLPERAQNETVFIPKDEVAQPTHYLDDEPDDPTGLTMSAAYL
jgi:hypothetical protein